ncbi:MAG: carbon-nitrogen hydrolase family protein [Gemmataceae bacterium]
MSTWRIAGVQMDCVLGEDALNLEAMRQSLAEAAAAGAHLVVFPECALSGYCYQSLDEALPHAQPLPGPATALLAEDCRRYNLFTVFGLLERDDAGQVFNAAALVGPAGLVASYRKIHLPHLGVDRFVTPGDRPFAVHDLGGLRVGMNICYDGGFPESARILTLLGADLVILPTNWPEAGSMIVRLSEARAIENHIYYIAVNRIGEERGFRFIGQSRIVSPKGVMLAEAGATTPEILYADINPAYARAKRVVKDAGAYEVDRINDRRPEMYGTLIAPGEFPPS